MMTTFPSTQEVTWRQRKIPGAEAVAPGVWSLPISNPSRPIRYVFVYAVVGTNGITLIDCGWDTEGTEEQLGRLLGELGAEFRDVVAILVTHAHPDHHGYARRLRELSGAPLALGAHELGVLDIRRGDDDAGHRAMLVRHLAACGVPEAVWDGMVTAHMATWPARGLAYPDRLLADGELVEVPGWGMLEALWTPGHSPGHVCFYSAERGLLFSGDHVLPRITPSVSSHIEQQPDPLTEYLQALERVQDLAGVEVLPGHQYRFSGLRERIGEILRHQSGRAVEICTALRDRPHATVWELAALLDWSVPFATLPVEGQRSAVAETYAHLVRLQLIGEVCEQFGAPERWRRTENNGSRHGEGVNTW